MIILQKKHEHKNHYKQIIEQDFLEKNIRNGSILSISQWREAKHIVQEQKIDVAVEFSSNACSLSDKDEISKGPVIGSLASKTGTLFIKRGDNIASTKMIGEMQSRFELKNKIIFFPEGKIGNGKKIKKFHSKLFKSIENKDMTIQPIAIRYPKDYPSDNSYSEEISYKSERGDMISLYLDFLMKAESHVILHFLDKVNTRDYDALSITNVLADKINKKLDNLNS